MCVFPQMYMCICVCCCICICMCICMYMCLLVYMYMCLLLHMYMYMFPQFAYVCVYVLVFVYVYVYVCILCHKVVDLCVRRCNSICVCVYVFRIIQFTMVPPPWTGTRTQTHTPRAKFANCTIVPVCRCVTYSYVATARALNVSDLFCS